jgi:hypothetical protein
MAMTAATGPKVGCSTTLLLMPSMASRKRWFAAGEAERRPGCAAASGPGGDQLERVVVNHGHPRLDDVYSGMGPADTSPPVRP